MPEQKTADVLTNEILRAEVEKLQRVVARYDSERMAREAEAMEARLEQHKLEEKAEADKVAASRRELDKLEIPRPENSESFYRLPIAIKSKIIASYGSSFLLDLAQKTKANVDWATWDKLNAEQPQRKN